MTIRQVAAIPGLFLSNLFKWTVWAFLFAIAWGFLAWLVVDLMMGKQYALGVPLSILLLIGAWSTYKAVFKSRARLSRFLWPVVRYMLGMSIAVGLMFAGGLFAVGGAVLGIYMWFTYVASIENGASPGVSSGLDAPITRDDFDATEMTKMHHSLLPDAHQRELDMLLDPSWSGLDTNLLHDDK
ncbi:hypothetical protein D6779_04570 [Candidatus Parcubacteria bacterium]|nr:MAG: hypothetical protein D6779_04570 [Candidatus Parcubacteria bacterium]